MECEPRHPRGGRKSKGWPPAAGCTNIGATGSPDTYGHRHVRAACRQSEAQRKRETLCTWGEWGTRASSRQHRAKRYDLGTHIPSSNNTQLNTPRPASTRPEDPACILCQDPLSSTCDGKAAPNTAIKGSTSTGRCQGLTMADTSCWLPLNPASGPSDSLPLSNPSHQLASQTSPVSSSHPSLQPPEARSSGSAGQMAHLGSNNTSIRARLGPGARITRS